MKYSNEHIDDYQNKLSNEDEKKLLEHSNKYDIEPVICAWYDNLEDFYSDWVDEVGYTKKQANNLLKDNKDEFLKFKDGRILRLVA